MNPDEPLVELSGWGRASRRRSTVRTPRTDDELLQVVQSSSRLTVRGAGRSYGDAAPALDGTVLDMTARRLVLSFDPVTGIAVVEAGATFGGARAGDAAAGLAATGAAGYGAGYRWWRGRQVVQLSPSEDADAFWATTGGMGLTGVILRVTLQLQRGRDRLGSPAQAPHAFAG